MNNEERIEAFLDSLSKGEGSISQFLGLLAGEIVYAPVIQFQNLRDAKGTNVIKVASFSVDNRNLLPVFTSEDYFLEWSAGRYQCFSLVAQDLALTIPADSWISINPGRENTVELAPEEARLLAEYDTSILDTESTLPAFDDLQSEDTYGDDPHSVEQEIDFSESPTMEFNFTRQVASEPPVEGGEDLQQEVYGILGQYPEVEEAYFHETSGGPTHAVLGMLTSGMDAERRFLLIDQIAETSRKYFGTAGAIEVYDDLDATTSSSWQLFSALAPFYVRGNEAAALTVERELLEKDLDEEEDSGLLGNFRKKGSRLLGALVGRS